MKTWATCVLVTLFAVCVFCLTTWFISYSYTKTPKLLFPQIETQIETEIETDTPLPLEGLHQNDARLIKRISDEKILRRFAPADLQVLKTAEIGDDPYSQHGQAKFVDDILKQRREGFFVEAGAYDGERFSNTLFLETQRNWTGLLVEADPQSCAKLADKKRHAYRLNACLSPTAYVTSFDFSFAQTLGGISSYMFGSFQKRMKTLKTGNTKVQCFPFFAVMQAMGVSHIDYFSLDTEGSEIDILRTIPFDEIKIDVLSIEIRHTNNITEAERLSEVRELMHANKYTEVLWDTLDIWFVK